MEIIRECDIRDVYDVHQHIKKYCELPNLFMAVREILVSSEFSVFKEGGICVILERIDPSTVQLHIYVDPEFRGKKCISFLQRLRDQVEVDKCVFRPPSGAKHIHRLLRYMGAVEVKEGYYELNLEVKTWELEQLLV